MSKPAPAPSARPPGRPSTFTPETALALIDIITQFGCSDTAAARRLGISSSTISHWKQEDPDLAPALRMAREEFRQTKLAIIFEAAAAEGGKGWRAAAWVLERVFPEDYHPKAAERAKFREMSEAAAALEPDAEAAPKNTPESSHNSRNAEAEVPRQGSPSAQSGLVSLPAGCDETELPSLDFLPGNPSRNSRNHFRAAEVPRPGGSSAKPGPTHPASPTGPSPISGSIAALLPAH